MIVHGPSYANFFGITYDWKSIAQKIAEDNGLWDYENNTWREIRPGQKINHS